MGLKSLGRLDEALAAYSQALALDPNPIRSLRERGEAYKALGQPEKASTDLRRAAELNRLRTQPPTVVEPPPA